GGGYSNQKDDSGGGYRATPDYQSGGYQSGGGSSGGSGLASGKDFPGTSETREDGIRDRAGDAIDNVYEQRKARAEEKVNRGIDAVEEALLPDNNVLGEREPTEG
ncbi:MAG TPA: hypothetical protein VM509_16280, partial [Planctomycetota bacterium]|nr:hypothetical protein [Planctomycetota bacterium]